MNNPSSFHSRSLLSLLVLCLCLALEAQAQFRGSSSSRYRGSPTSSSSSGGSTPRSYPNAASIGDAYFSIDPETRRVVAIADEKTMQYISEVLSNLDRPKPQVLIKVVFVEVTYNSASDIGIEGGWGRQGMNGTITSANAANVFGLGSLTSPATNVLLNALGQPVSSFRPSGPVTSPGAGLYQILGQDYQVTLRAIAQAGRAKILSRPSILARNNQPATIFVGQQYPVVNSTRYDNYGNVINSFQYQPVGVQLTVTPFITAEGLVEMIVTPQISAVSPTTAVQISSGVSVQAIDQRAADTVAVTADGETIVIGGLIQDSKAKNETKIPLLGDIPLLGNLFKRRQNSDAKTELIIFLTPHIVQNPTELAALSDRERANSDAAKAFKEQELNKLLDSLPMQEPAPPVMQSNSDSPPKP